MDGLLTVEENLLFAARLAGLGGRLGPRGGGGRDRAGRARARARRQPARELSGGWRRLLDIARATLHQPDLLILDEPTVGLDPEHRDAVWALLEVSAPRPTGPPCSSPPTISRRPSRPTGWCCWPAGRVVADDAPGALRAELGDEIAEIEGAGRRAAGAGHPRARVPRAWCFGPGGAFASASRASASRWSSSRAAPRASSASPCDRRRWRMSTSPAPRGRPPPTCRSRYERVERGSRHRRPRPGAQHPADQPAPRRRGAPVHVAAARGDRLQRDREAGQRAAVSGLRVSRASS